MLIRTSLMIAVGENEKHVLQDWDKKLTEEDTRRLSISFGHVIHQFKTHCEAGVFHFAIVMFASPHARINYKLELRCIKFKQGRETVQIDGLEQLEKLDTVLWIFVEIFIDHFQRGFKDAFHDQRYLVFHQILKEQCVRPNKISDRCWLMIDSRVVYE